MDGIPPARETDAEDVAWALQTAEALWKRNERGDAIVWLRRAAQAAGEANDDDRALALAREAAELTEAFARASSAALPTVPPSTTEGSVAGVEIEALLRTSQLDAAEAGLAVSAPSGGPSPVVAGTPPPPLDPAPPVQPATAEVTPSLIRPGPPPLPSPAPTKEPQPEPVSDGERFSAIPISIQPESVALEEASPAPKFSSAPPVPSAAESHAGMLDPWSDSDELAPVGAPEKRPHRDGSVPAAAEFDEEVITSAGPIAKARGEGAPTRATPPPQTATVSAPPPRETSVKPPKPPPPRPKSVQQRAVTVPRPTLSSAPRPAARAAPARAVAAKVAPSPPSSPPPAERKENVEAAAPRAPAVEVSPKEPALEPASNGAAVEMPTAPDSPTETAVSVGAPRGPLDLSAVEAFADLPDDARDKLARLASVRSWAKGDKGTGFALAYVAEGDVYVQAKGAATYATLLPQGSVLRARGTLDQAIGLELSCASARGAVATWDDEAVESGLGPCPWVEDDLRASGDRVQALAGATLGALGQRLTPELRSTIVEKLTMRALTDHETLVTEGIPVPGILLVGAGKVELVANDVVTMEVSPGEFVLPAEALSAGASPVSARAATGGALVFAADRKTTQMIFATEPLLLELFAGW